MIRFFTPFLLLMSLPAASLPAADDAALMVTPVDLSPGDPARPPRIDPAATEAGAAAITVSQKEKAFSPESVQIRTGEVIAILNDDAVVHNVYCRADEFKYNSGPQKPGVRATIAFSASGRYEVRCAIHPKMLLTVDVRD